MTNKSEAVNDALYENTERFSTREQTGRDPFPCYRSPRSLSGYCRPASIKKISIVGSWWKLSRWLVELACLSNK